MKVSVLIPGGFKSEEYEALARNYIKLSGKFASIQLVELGLAQDQALTKWLEKRGSRVYLTLLDERGKMFSSREFASKVEKIKDASHSDWAIAIGGAHGYGKELQERAQLLWSLSPLTFAHELAAVVASEQIFRAFSILNGHPYHND